MPYHNNHLAGTDLQESVSLQPESQYTDYETAAQETDTSKYIIPDHNHKLLSPPTLALTLRPFDSIAFSTTLLSESCENILVQGAIWINPNISGCRS